MTEVSCEYDPLASSSWNEDDLDESMYARAQSEVHEKPEWRKRDIEALRDILQDDGGVICPNDDAFLLRFLRANHFDYEDAQKMIHRYYGGRKKCPENYVNTLPSLARHIFAHQLQTVLPHRDKHGRRVFLFRAGHWNTGTTTMADIFAANYLTLELLAHEPKTQITGLVMIVDMQDLGMHHIWNVTVEQVRNLANLLQGSFPLRFREIHIINESYLFDIAFAIIKPFLSEKISKRVTCHGVQLERLYSIVPKEILPADFAKGDLEPFDNKDLYEALRKKEQLFQEISHYGLESSSRNPKEDQVLQEDHHPMRGNYCF